VVRKILPFLLFSILAFSQADLAQQTKIIKELIPNATRVGLVYNPSTNIDSYIQEIVAETGVRVVKAPVTSIREVSQAVRSLDRYDVNFILLLEERTVTSNNSIKFVVKQTVKKKIPVFTTAGNALSAGAYGQLVQEGGYWRIKINGKVAGRFDITVPEGNDKFTIEE